MSKLLFLHRWVGVALVLFMLLWFSSGFVIANSGSISLTRTAQLAHAQSLAPEAGWLSLGAVLRRSPVKNVVDARLLRIAGAPAWVVDDDLGRRVALSALDGRALAIGPEQAQRIAFDWLAAEHRSAGVAWLDTTDSVVGLRNAEALKPFHRLSAADDAGTIIVVSGKSGEVLQAATRVERGLYYVGGWVHLFRPLDLLGAAEWRRDALSYAGFFAFVGAVTGVVIGWIKWKPGFFGRPTYARGRTQPYRESWLKYHFWAGLIGGVFALMWAGSGWLSTNPGQIFSQPAPSREELARFRGGDLPRVAKDWAPAPVPVLDPTVVELRWTRLGDDAALIAYDRDGGRRALAIDGARAAFEAPALLAAAQRLAGATPIRATETIDAFDSYYSAGHGAGAIDRPLPALRVDLGDASHTALYLDPLEGRLLLRIDDSRRAYRWLYSAVHHWDFGFFAHHPAVRRIWLVLWISFGLTLAGSAVVLAWRRLRRSLPARAEDRGAAPTVAPAE
jgi:hypothetical protein